ncbi:hypothetical protein Golomagni_05489 [Golovinomyces magnicellulatus]|nr:hypothetical protein Golomagni_05489 [Golovinomyces magnicellulatus]
MTFRLRECIARSRVIYIGNLQNQGKSGLPFQKSIPVPIHLRDRGFVGNRYMVGLDSNQLPILFVSIVHT